MGTSENGFGCQSGPASYGLDTPSISVRGIPASSELPADTVLSQSWGIGEPASFGYIPMPDTDNGYLVSQCVFNSLPASIPGRM